MGEVWFASDDPSLPTPWKGVVDGTIGCLYYWNPETNITQYEKPAYWVSSLSPSPSCFPDPFYPPPSTTFDYNIHSQYPNLYPHYQAPAEIVISGYTFPTQFPFPNHTHTPTNQPINPQSQSTDYHYHSLTHSPIAHPSYHLPPLATSAYPSESDGYLSTLPYPLNKPFSCESYSTSPQNSSYSPITYPHTEPNESIVHPYQLPYATDLIPPSALAYTVGGTSCTEKAEVPPPEMKKSLRHNLKMRSHVMMKRKPRSQFPRRRRTQNNGSSEGDLCKAPLLMAVNWDSTVLSNISLDSVSELTILDLVVKNGFISTSRKDAPMFFPGDDVDAMYNQLLGSDELYQTERAKDILLLEGFWQILDKKGGPMVDWELRSIHTEVARLYLNLSLEKPITNLGNSSLVNHFCHLVIDVDNFSLVTNLISGLQPTLLSMSFVELLVILVVPLPESYQQGVKHEVVEFDQFMVCSFAVRELIKTLRVAHLAHLRATLYNWKVGVKNVLSCSKGGFEYDMHLENLIESLTRHYQNLFVNIHGKGIEHKCSVMYHWLLSSNWNQALLLGQGINFQHGFSFIEKDIVCLHYNLCFLAEMRFLGLITSFVQIGLETIMQTFSHTWDLQIHQLQIYWITTVNAFIATLSHGLNKENLVVIFGISSGTIDLPNLVISNDQFEVMVTSCHFLGGEYSDNVWLFFVTSKDQRVKLIPIAMENPVQRLSFLFDLNSKNKVIAFVIEICNQERHTGKDKHEALDDIRASTVVMCAPLLVENVTTLVTLKKHNNEALDDIGVVAFVYISFVVFQHSHFPREVKLLDVVEFPRDSKTGNALATFWLCGVTAMSSLKEDWVPHIPSLIEMLIKALIVDTKLNFATESYMTPTGAIATEFVFNFGAALSINTLDIHIVYSIMCLPYLKELFLEMFAVGLLLYCSSMDVDIIWCSPLLDFTFGQPIQQYQFSVQLDFQVTTVMDMYLESRGRKIGLLIFTRCMNQQMLGNTLSKISHHTFLQMAMKLLYHYILGYSSVNYVVLLVGHHFGVNVECGTLKGCMSDVGRQLHLDVTSLLRLDCICNEMAHKEVSLVMLAVDWRTVKTHVLDTAVSSFMITPIIGEAWALLCIFKITEHMITRHIQGLKLIETLVLSMLAFIVINRLHVGNILAILLECSTFYIDAFYSLEVVMMEVSQLASQSTTQILCYLALLFNADHTKFTAADGMINEVTGKVIVDALIPFIMLINGSCGDCNAQKPKTNSFHAKMWGDDIQSTKHLINEDPSDVVVHTKATAAIGGHMVQFPTCSILRHEDMPSLKGGGMIGSWLTELHYLNGLIIILG